MKICKYQHYNETANEFDGDQPIIAPFIIIENTDAIPSGYIDLCDTEANALLNWHTFGSKVIPTDLVEDDVKNFGDWAKMRAWKSLRKEIVTRAETITGGSIGSLTTPQWDILMTAQKLIVVEYAINKLSDAQIGDACSGDLSLIGYLSQNFDKRSIIGRKKFFMGVRQAALTMIANKSEALLLLKKINGLGLELSFYGGLEGVDEGDGNSGIYDWIKTQNEYLLNGLTTQPITFKAGYDMTIFKDE